MLKIFPLLIDNSMHLYNAYTETERELIRPKHTSNYDNWSFAFAYFHMLLIILFSCSYLLYKPL